MTTIFAAILFIATSGGLFTSKFRKNVWLRTSASLVAIVSGLYLVSAIYDDVRGFLNRGSLIREGQSALSIPEAETNTVVSSFAYQVLSLIHI